MVGQRSSDRIDEERLGPTIDLSIETCLNVHILVAGAPTAILGLKTDKVFDNAQTNLLTFRSAYSIASRIWAALSDLKPSILAITAASMQLCNVFRDSQTAYESS